jgi:hypothetical protein
MKTIQKQTRDAAMIILGVGAVCIAIATMSGCGSSDAVLQGPAGTDGATGAQGAQGLPGPTVTVTPAPSPTTTESAVQVMVDTENAYRNSVGQEALFPGLTCTLYTVPTTTTLIIGATGLVQVGSWDFTGVFNQANGPTTAGLNILPTNLQGVYQSWYIVKCTGDLVVGDSNWHEFDVNSDDGSNLYVDGILINNDGLHGAQDKSASKYLKYGIHSFELDYLQAGGNEALILNEDGALMGNQGFYH